MEADPSLTPITSVTVAWSDKISDVSDGGQGMGEAKAAGPRQGLRDPDVQVPGTTCPLPS